MKTNRPTQSLWVYSAFGCFRCAWQHAAKNRPNAVATRILASRVRPSRQSAFALALALLIVLSCLASPAGAAREAATAGPGSELSLESDYLPQPIHLYLNREIHSVRLTGKAPVAADGQGDIWLDTRPAELNAFGDVVKRMGPEPGSIHVELRYQSTGPIKLTDRLSPEGTSRASAGFRLYDVVFPDSAWNDHLKLVLGTDQLGPHRLLVFHGVAGKHLREPTHILPLNGEPRITSVLPDAPLSNPVYLSGSYTAAAGARHMLHVRGTLGGEGSVMFDPNFIGVDDFGEATMFTLIGYFPQPVTLNWVDVPDPLGQGRRLYRAVSKSSNNAFYNSSNNTNRVSLVLGPTEIGPHRFLVCAGEQVVYLMPAQLPERRAQEVAASSYARLSSGEQQAITDLQRTVGYDFRCTVEGGQAVDLTFSGFTRAPPPEGVLARLPHLRSITFYSGRFAGSCLADLQHLEQLHSLGFSSAEFEPAGLEMLGNIRQLDELTLYLCGGIDDEGLKHLAKMTRLKWLRLYREELPRQPPLTGRRITDAGFAHLKGLIKLEHLDLLGHDLSDASVEILTSMTRLQDLGLSGKGFTDAGLNGLARLPNLRKLQLLGTGVTTNGVTAFKAQRPKTQVEAGSLE